jgi:uroporphyrinogen decarboxylase
MGLFINLINGKEVERNPIWFMRQAGRYLPEYKEVRKNFKNFLDFCYTPDAAMTVTIQPITRYNIDAAIIFSDILVIPDMLGMKVTFSEGLGPEIEFNEECLANEFAIAKKKAIAQAISLTKENLAKDLIGFAGAPFTLAYYILGGKKTAREERIKHFNKDLMLKVIHSLTSHVIAHLCNQIEAGVDCVKIFDSWAGLLEHDEDLLAYSVEPMRAIIAAVRAKYPNFPIIVFPRNVGKKIDLYIKSLNNVVFAIGDDVNIYDIFESNKKVIFQGNISNRIFFEEISEIEYDVVRLCQAVKSRPHIYNLNHGILPETDPNKVGFLVEKIREYDRKSGKHQQ